MFFWIWWNQKKYKKIKNYTILSIKHFGTIFKLNLIVKKSSLYILLLILFFYVFGRFMQLKTIFIFDESGISENFNFVISASCCQNWKFWWFELTITHDQHTCADYYKCKFNYFKYSRNYVLFTQNYYSVIISNFIVPCPRCQAQ